MRGNEASFVPLLVETDIFRAVRGRTHAKRLRSDTLEAQAVGRVKEERSLETQETKDRRIIIKCLKYIHDFQEQHKSDCLRMEAPQKRDSDSSTFIGNLFTFAECLLCIRHCAKLIHALSYSACKDKHSHTHLTNEETEAQGGW